MILSKQLKIFMTKRGMTISQLARVSGVPKQTISDWTSGRKPQSLTSLKKVADALGTTIDCLCFEESHKVQIINEFKDEINAGVFEVVLRKVRKN
jgi:transcriptional regulator with XRE-family HTH domain